MSRYYIAEPPSEPSEPTPVYNYGSVYSNIYNELQNIDAELNGIKGHLSTIATNSTDVKTSLGTVATKQSTIADKQSTIADKQSAIETYQKKLKELGEGPGIHVIGPYELFSMISIYRLLIEQAGILEDTDIASNDKIRDALQRAKELMTKINTNIPASF